MQLIKYSNGKILYFSSKYTASLDPSEVTFPILETEFHFVDKSIHSLKDEVGTINCPVLKWKFSYFMTLPSLRFLFSGTEWLKINFS